MMERAVMVLDPGIDGTGMVAFRLGDSAMPLELAMFNRLNYARRASALIAHGLARGLTPADPMPDRLHALGLAAIDFANGVGHEVHVLIEEPAIAGLYGRNAAAMGARAMSARTDKLHQAIGALCMALRHRPQTRVEMVPPLRSNKKVKMAAAAAVLAEAGKQAPRNKDVLDAIALGFNVNASTELWR